MSGSNKINNYFQTAFYAVRNANAAKRIKGKKMPMRKNFPTHPRSADINFHAVGPTWTGKPAITLRLSIPRCSRELFCFNLTPAIDRHRTVSKSKIRGFFLTTANWDNIGKSNSMLLSNKIKQMSNDDALPMSGPPGFVGYVKRMLDNFQNARLTRQFHKRYKFIEEESVYKSHCIEISKIIANPMLYSETERHIDSMATASYLCTIFFDKTNEDIPLNLESFNEPVKDDISPTSFAVLDCPSTQHFEKIKDSRLWSEFESSQREISAIIHLSPNDIFYNNNYREWISTFGNDCKHFIVNNKAPYIYTLSDYEHISKLRQISPSLFPSVDETHTHTTNDIQDNVYKVDGRMSILLKSDDCIVQDDLWRAQSKDYKALHSKRKKISDTFPTVLDELSKNLVDLKSPGSVGYFPSITILGSGSAYENTLRAQPAFLLRLDKNSSILLDCGEQTVERIYLTFGNSAPQVLASIKLILLSHRHSDHHSGFDSTINAIVRSGGARKQKVFCLMPSSVQSIYRDTLQKNAHFVDTCILANQASNPLSEEKSMEIIRTLPLKMVSPVKVDHNVLTFGIVIITRCGQKIAYSSDTLPMSPQLIAKGHNADLLIHDCLYVEDGMATEARLRKHGFFGDAVATGDAMNAKFTMLTHFAPQYPLIPFEYEPEKYSRRVCPAIDFLSVSLSDLQKLPHLMKAFEEIFMESLSRGRMNARSGCIRRMERNVIAQELASIIQVTKK